MDCAAKTFPFFPNLPRELRDKIWKQSLPGPRVVEIFPPLKNENGGGVYGQELDISPRSSAVFSTLHVCWESREIALKYYQPEFHHVLGGRPIYFNFETDTLFLNKDISSFRMFEPSLEELDYESAKDNYCMAQRDVEDLADWNNIEKSIEEKTRARENICHVIATNFRRLTPERLEKLLPKLEKITLIPVCNPMGHVEFETLLQRIVFDIEHREHYHKNGLSSTSSELRTELRNPTRFWLPSSPNKKCQEKQHYNTANP